MRDVVGLTSAGGLVYAQTVEGHVYASDGAQPWRLIRKSPRAGFTGLNFVATTGRGQGWAVFQSDIGAETVAGRLEKASGSAVG